MVKDDGKGFNARENENGAENTYGLRIMRERASEIGARLNIESSEGMGAGSSSAYLYWGQNEIKVMLVDDHALSLKA